MFLSSVKSVTTHLELDQLSITGLNSTHTHADQKKEIATILLLKWSVKSCQYCWGERALYILHTHTTNPTWGEIGRALQGNSPSGRGSVPETAVSVVAPLPENTRTSYFHPIMCILTYTFCCLLTPFVIALEKINLKDRIYFKEIFLCCEINLLISMKIT